MIMIKLIKKLFGKSHYESGEADNKLHSILTHYINSEHELSALNRYCREIIRDKESCHLLNVWPSKRVIIRYGISPWSCRLAWYLLEQYEKGNIEIKDQI